MLIGYIIEYYEREERMVGRVGEKAEAGREGWEV